MRTAAQDQKRAESLLQHRGIQPHDIQSFSFMKRFHEAPRKNNLKVKDKYGAGILTIPCPENGRLQKSRRQPISGHPSICSISLRFSLLS